MYVKASRNICEANDMKIRCYKIADEIKYYTIVYFQTLVRRPSVRKLEFNTNFLCYYQIYTLFPNECLRGDKDNLTWAADRVCQPQTNSMRIECG